MGEGVEPDTLEMRELIMQGVDSDRMHATFDALRESEQRFRDIAENITEVFWLTNSSQEVIYVSPAYEEIWGRTCEACYANPSDFVDGIHEEDRPLMLSRLERKSAGFDIEYRVVRPDGSIRFIHDRAFPVRDDEGNVIRVAGIAEDITERRHLEHQLRHAQKMVAVGRLAGGIAHDFNNLLTVIKGHAGFLSATLPPDGDSREDIDQISSAAERAAELTKQLLAFSMQQVLEKRAVDMNALLRDMEKMLVRLIGEDVVLTLSLQPNAVSVLADPSQVEQAVMNLVVNARDAMPKGGDLRLSTRSAVLTPEAARRYPGCRGGEYVVIEVKDGGAGIPPEVIARIFDPFFTTKDAGGGTGLGLATAYGIVQQMGGFIDVESTPGKGSTFTIFLPAAPPIVAVAETRAASLPERGHELILLVEDQDDVRTVVRRILVTRGYRVVEARNGMDALAVLQGLETKIDLVVTDAVMPQMGGVELVRELRARQPDLPVVMVSGYTDNELVNHGASDLGVPFLDKPFLAEDLLRVVRKALDAE